MSLNAALFFAFFMFAAYVGYPLFAFVLARLFNRRVSKASFAPRVSVILPVYNEGDRVRAKVANLLAQEYPRACLEIIVVDDGSSDGAVARLGSEGVEGVTVITQDQRRGKAAALNAGLSVASGDVLVFTDARQELAPGALAALMENFNDPRVAAVTGRLEPANAGAEGLFRVYEESLRSWESAWGSCAGATGALYAVRREFAAPIPEDTILDDLLLSLGAARFGRLVYEREALALEAPEEPARVISRRLRTLAGNWQILFHPRRFSAAYSPRTLAQVVFHKWLRLFFPFCALGLVVSLLLAGGAFAVAAISCVAFLCLLAVVPLPRRANLCLRELLAFLLFAPVHALLRYALGRETVLWTR